MNNWTIEETFKLPSEGKVYDCEVKPEISLRNMSTNEEMLRLSPSDFQYAQMCKMLDACVTNDLGISAYDMCLGDYIYSLYMLRVVTYGADYKISPTCNFCKKTSKEHFNLQDLKVKGYTPEVLKYMEFDLPVTKKHIKLKMQTPRILDTTIAKVKYYKNKFTSGIDPTFLCEIMFAIDTVDNVRLNEVELEDFVHSLNMQDANTILNYSRKLNDTIGVDNEIFITCESCGRTYSSRLAITSEFFRPSLDI